MGDCIKNLFIKYVKSECKKSGVKVDIRNVSYLKMSGNIKCSGYFDAEAKILVCAKNSPNWLEVLIHEFCHYLQWKENCPAWVNGIESIDPIDRWIGGEEIENIEYHLGMARDLELDNEKRSVDMIIKWGLDSEIDVNTYTKKANAYVLFYNWLGKTRKWSKPGNAPYKNEKILNTMSEKFDMNYDTLDSNIERIFMIENI
jgi:hypothetical protein